MAIQDKTQKKFTEGRGYTREDWEAVDSPELTEDELARMKPARDVLPPDFFKAVEESRRARGRPRVEAPKEAVTLRLDPTLLTRFKATGKNWRAKMVEVLERAKV